MTASTPLVTRYAHQEEPEAALQRRVKVYFLLKRRHDITRQEFLAYWRGEHRKQVAKLAKCKSYICKVEQFHPHAPLRLNMDEFFSSHPSQKNLATPQVADDWDGILMFELASLADLQSFFSEHEYAAQLRPDEAKFIDIARSQILVGQPPEWNDDHAATYADAH